MSIGLVIKNIEFWKDESWKQNFWFERRISGWRDLNPRPFRPERNALAKLRYTPKKTDIPTEPEKSVFRLERKLPRIDDRRLGKLVRINAIRTNLRLSIIGALSKPKSRFFRFCGYILLDLDLVKPAKTIQMVWVYKQRKEIWFSL